ncbi:MAG: SsrA-binding protein, partial [Clostridia bacterium]
QILMHKKEIDRLYGKMQEKGFTIIPLKIYLKGSLIKMEIAMCKGKQTFDKRQTIKDREENRNMQRVFKEYNAR